MGFYYVYILKSTLKFYYYTGCTENLSRRFIDHNDKIVKSSSPYAPFELIYYEACLNKIDAYRREKYLKSKLGKKYLKFRLKEWINSQ